MNISSQFCREEKVRFGSAFSRMFYPVDACSSWAEAEVAVCNGDIKDVIKSCSIRKESFLPQRGCSLGFSAPSRKLCHFKRR